MPWVWSQCNLHHLHHTPSRARYLLRQERNDSDSPRKVYVSSCVFSSIIPPRATWRVTMRCERVCVQICMEWVAMERGVYSPSFYCHLGVWSFIKLPLSPKVLWIVLSLVWWCQHGTLRKEIIRRIHNVHYSQVVKHSHFRRIPKNALCDSDKQCIDMADSNALN